MPTNGQTAGHMSIWLEGGAGAALFSGGVMHHPLRENEPQLSSVPTRTQEHVEHAGAAIGTA
jgi:glyoxylase-like metal-dependent hydrolase (beta-lactamase superfamily II)